MRRQFFFQQNDTKIKDFDEGVLIVEPFFWGNVIFNICYFCIKSHDWGGEEFLWVAPPDCSTTKLRNECFPFIHAVYVFQSKSRHSTRGSQTMDFLVTMSIVTFETEVANFENDIPSEKRPYRINTPSSKLVILVSSCWKKFFLRIKMYTTISFSPSFPWN